MSKVKEFLEKAAAQPKWFLLMAGADYYPAPGQGNFIKAFASHDEANTYVQDKSIILESQWGGRADRRYEIDGIVFDWYHIVDLRPWCLENKHVIHDSNWRGT